MRRWTGNPTLSLAVALGILVHLGACAAEPSTAAAGKLERLLLAGDGQAVDLAKQQGAGALPVLRQFSNHEDYRIRQIAVTCAGRLEGAEAAGLLAAGLRDSNINVRLAAANELAAKPWPGAAKAILEQIGQSADDTVRETLVLAAGHVPGSQTESVLRPLASGQGAMAVNAQMALARLGDPAARKTLLAGLSATSPRERYDALDRLRYVNDPALAPAAKALLNDRAPASRIGVLKAQRFRRVCDQAVDTVVYLRKLSMQFEVHAERIYSENELALVGRR